MAGSEVAIKRLHGGTKILNCLILGIALINEQGAVQKVNWAASQNTH
jgi:nitrogen-specific signal transduction histidine kinase